MFSLLVSPDVYSFGVILYELLVRHRYFAEDLWMSKLETKIIGGVRPALPDECLPEYRYRFPSSPARHARHTTNVHMSSPID